MVLPRTASTAGLMVVLAMIMLGTTMPTAVYATYQREFGFSLLTVTIIYATYAVGVLVALLALGTWSDVLGRRPLLLGGIGCAIASDVVFLLADDTAMLLVGRLVSGLSAGVFVGTASVAIIEMAPRHLAARAPLMASMANIGGLGLGPVTAAMLITWFPTPTRTPYAVHLGLMVIAALIVFAVPETRPRDRDTPVRLTVMPLSVPAEVRPVFVRAAILGFAGFAVLGLITAVTPTLAATVVGVHSVIGVAFLVFAVFAGSIVGQNLGRRLDARPADAVAIALFVVGMGLLVATVHIGRWEVLAAAAAISGMGQGIAFARGLAGIAAAAPAATKAAVTSAYFVVIYVGISLPVVAEGVLSNAIGIRTASEVFAAAVVVMAVVAGALGVAADRRGTPSPAGGRP
ncbi:MFS transporter [Williamsia sp. CHRR-6]|nr:MFS transporter [Williamsia sp. CHRR-6]